MRDPYYDNPMLSNSMLSVLKRSPREFYQRFIAKTWSDEPSAAMQLGSLVHCLSLEPQTFDSRYAIAPKCDRRTKEGKAAYSEFERLSAEREVVTEKDHDTAMLCASRLWQHDQLSQLFPHAATHDAQIERPLTFTIEGTECKAKPDWLSVPRKLIVDVKTTQDASPSGFARSVANYGYHRQAAFYLAAAEAVFGIEARFIFAAVETKPPFEVACYELSHSDLKRGMDEVLTLIDDYERRKATNNWDQVWSSGIVPLDLPRWYKSEIYESEGGEDE